MNWDAFRIDVFDAQGGRTRLEAGEVAPCLAQGLLELPHGLQSLNAARPDRPSAHYLRITRPGDPDWRPFRFSGNGPLRFRFRATPVKDRPPMVLAYFLNSYMSPGFLGLAHKQLAQLTASGLAQQPGTLLQVVLLGNQEAERQVVALLEHLRIPRYRVRTYPENNHEYHGIRVAQELAWEFPGAYLLYFHGKGIKRLKPGTTWKPKSYERFLFPEILTRWRQNVAWLDHILSCDKTGLYCGDQGMVWLNFWWVRASHLQTREIPIQTSDRYYYERWISRASDPNSSLDRCCSMWSNPFLDSFNAGTDYRPENGNMTLKHWRWLSLGWWFREQCARRWMLRAQPEWTT